MAKRSIEPDLAVFCDDSDTEVADATTVGSKRRRTMRDIGAIPDDSDDIPNIYGWHIVVKKPQDPYKDPAVFGALILEGEKVTNHPVLEEGGEISTSPLAYFIGDTPGKTYAKTASRWYRLWQPTAEYVTDLKNKGKSPWNKNGTHINHHLLFPAEPVVHADGVTRFAVHNLANK